MKPKFKILENKDGKFEVYYVEYITEMFHTRQKLIPYITWAGLNKVYEFSSLEIAIEELKKEIIFNTELIKNK